MKDRAEKERFISRLLRRPPPKRPRAVGKRGTHHEDQDRKAAGEENASQEHTRAGIGCSV